VYWRHVVGKPALCESGVAAGFLVWHAMPTFFDPGAGGTVHFKNNWFDTLTGRLGYAVAPS
jgi:hypothetical protein